MAKKAKRLFEQFQPEHYELLLNPSATDLAFSGSVTIRGKKTSRPAKRITLHQKGLKITKVQITRHDKKGDREISISRVNNHESLNEVRLHSTEMIYPGDYTIRLDFTGKITSSLSGIYAARFTDKNTEKIILATQFESHHAREAFPCIDEPQAKATFALSVTAPKDLAVLSNTPLKEKRPAGKLNAYAFETTPKMSTYLLAFVIGDLHCVETKTKNGVAVRSWASVAQPKSHLEYSAKEAAAILDFFADYFGVPYPLKKLDQVALPDFDAGAMENWGLVTYREIALLADDKNRSIANEQYITLVIAHELSHQWFGNLVTMKWWGDLWLNESFAGLMEHIAPAALHPDWNQWELYAMSDIALITSRDVYKDIQPVGVEVTDPDLIPTLFDPAIVYAKGARLLKMLREYIGEEAFIKGLRDYFGAHAYGNATRDDLWRALGAASGRDIESFMASWLTQPGMPVVHATQKGNKLQLVQERFLLDSSADDSLWPIPLLAGDGVSPDIFSTKEAAGTLSSEDYALINHSAGGQYITDYTEPGHKEYLGKAIENQTIPPESRINALNDMYMLARHGDTSLTDVLDVISLCAGEPRDSVWGQITRAVGAAGQLTEGDKTAEEHLKRLRVMLARDWHKKLGWENQPKDNPNTRQLRHTMAALMVGGEDPSAVKTALGYYKKARDLGAIPAELRATILIAAVRAGQPKNIENLISGYPHVSPDIQQDIATALTATKDAKLAAKLLPEAFGKNGFVRAQDTMRWLALFLRNHHIRQTAWEYMVENWEWFEKTLQDSKSFDYLPTYAAAIISTPEWAAKYQKLFEPLKSNKLLKRNIEIGLADIASRTAWRKRDEAKIKQWLKEHVKPRPNTGQSDNTNPEISVAKQRTKETRKLKA